MPPRPTLLVIEDDTQIVELMEATVRALGVEVARATTGKEALALLAERRPAVVTLDLVLPDIDGFAVLERVRASEELAATLVVVVSALAEPEVVRRAYALGAADYVTKPFVLDLLEAKLRSFLRLRALADEVSARERFLVEVVENLSSGLAVFDEQGRFVRLNAAGALQLGLVDAQPALGRHVGEVAPGAEPFLDTSAAERQRRATVATPLGPRQLGFTSGPLSGGGVVVVFRELSHAEVARRDAETRARLDALGRAARSLAHEARNPLAAISAAAQMLMRAEVDRDLRLRMSEAIAGEAERIAGLVREYVELQAPAAPHGQVDVRALLEEILEVNLLASPARHRIGVSCAESLPRVRGDAARVKQVLLNLTLAAVAATERGGVVHLKALAARGGVELVVADSGHGIAEDDLPHIFEEEFSRRAGREGLGLPIARRIVHEHGGTVRVESAAGRGTTFTVWLPAIRRER